MEQQPSNPKQLLAVFFLRKMSQAYPLNYITNILKGKPIGVCRDPPSVHGLVPFGMDTESDMGLSKGKFLFAFLCVSEPFETHFFSNIVCERKTHADAKLEGAKRPRM